MPLPLIIGAAALATAAYGAKKGYDGYQKHSEADEIVKSAKSRYELKKSRFDEQESDTQSALEKLGNKKLEIGKSISEFKHIAEDLIQQLNLKQEAVDLAITIPPCKIRKIEEYSITALGVLGTVVGAGTAGAATGFAVYGGVMTLGFASTGTAISTLSGAAASKAALAAIGGGALKAGGLGVAGGTAVLGAAVAAPVLAIAGWAYDSHGEEALRNARKIRDEVDSAIEKMAKAAKSLIDTEFYVREIKNALGDIFEKFQNYHATLREIDEFLKDTKGKSSAADREVEKFNDQIIHAVSNGYALAAILVDICTTPIFKLKKSGDEIITDDDGVPELELDSNGLNIINENEIKQTIKTANSDSENIEDIIR